MSDSQGALDGSDGGAYRLPLSIWGSFLSPKVGFLHSGAQVGALLPERFRTVTDGRPRIDMNKSGRFFPHPSPLPGPLDCRRHSTLDTISLQGVVDDCSRMGYSDCSCYASWSSLLPLHLDRKPLGGTAKAKQRGTEHIDQVELELYLRYSPEDMYRYTSTPDSIKKSAHIFDMSPTAGFLRTSSLLPVKSTDTLGRGDVRSRQLHNS